ncbi:MAG: thiamine diphosphokinase [Clostridia bacterium]|nr:thiamine diphosphokinase [Clostridia bacterium]
MYALIISNGAITNYSFYYTYLKSASLVICSDGGARHARKFGIKPDVLLGDFDSVEKEDLNYYKGLGVEIVKYQKEKDLTDTEIAVNLALERGFKSIFLIGCLGSRFDHSMANVMLLKSMLLKGCEARIINENNEIALIKDHITLKRGHNEKVTLIPISEKVQGVTTKGLYYSLDNETLLIGSTRGVSNEFISDHAEISIQEGLMLVIKSRD